jgi:hypothetical protein
MRSPNLTWDELHDLNHLESEVTTLVREIREIGYDDAPEALAKLDGIVAACSEHRARVLRRAAECQDRIEQEEARREMASAIPPLDVPSC